MQFRRDNLQIFVFQKPIDMGCRFHKLTAFVREAYKMQTLLDGHVSVFFGNNRHRLKIIYFDGSGLILLAKRIERGRFMWIQELGSTTINFGEVHRRLCPHCHLKMKSNREFMYEHYWSK